jgi:hypothetical protein
MAQQTSFPFDVKCLGCKRVTCYTSLDHSTARRLLDVTQPHLADTALSVHG